MTELVRIEGKIDAIQQSVSTTNSAVVGLGRDMEHMAKGLGKYKNEQDDLHEDVHALKSDVKVLRAVVKAIWGTIMVCSGIIFWLLKETGVFLRIFDN